ncbi:hypothetical protein Tco_0696631 [Tanacetum coccineum]
MTSLTVLTFRVFEKVETRSVCLCDVFLFQLSVLLLGDFADDNRNARSNRILPPRSSKHAPFYPRPGAAVNGSILLSRLNTLRCGEGLREIPCLRAILLVLFGAVESLIQSSASTSHDLYLNPPRILSP